MELEFDDEPRFIKVTDLISKIKVSLQNGLSRSYRVIGRIENLNLHNKNDAFYFDIADNNDSDRPPKLDCCIYKKDNILVYNRFQNDVKSDMEVVLTVEVRLFPRIGLKLVVKDFQTKKELEDEKQKILKRLTQENIIQYINGNYFSKNKNLSLPIVIQRIALITSPEIKGDVDFRTKLDRNKNQHKYFYPYREQLFVSVQGMQSPKEIVGKLNFLLTKKEEIDVVIIVRGGGKDSDFNCFNNYELNKEIANYPIPVIVGIGHQPNESIIDIVSHTSTITPTETAETIIHHNEEFERNLINQKEIIAAIVKSTIANAKNNITQLRKDLERETNLFITDTKYFIGQYFEKVNNLSPEKVLSRGYALITYKGNFLANLKGLKPGNELKILMKSNVIDSQIIKLKKRNENEFNL